MEIIGAGFGRTGTMSLKAALEVLGFGPCYHMVEVFGHPEHADVWQRPLGAASRWTGKISSGITGRRLTGRPARFTGG